jgi:hypothetical protein
MTAPGTLPTVRRHPGLGALGGLLLGAGAALWLVLYGRLALGTWAPLLVPLAGAIAGFAWGTWGPVRGTRPTPPPAVPAHNERVQQALSDNKAAIDEAGNPPPSARGTVPGIGPPTAGDHTDWHRHDDHGPASGGNDPPS